MMKFPSYINSNLKFACLGIAILLVATSCKNDATGSDDDSFFSFNWNKVEELGTASTLKKELGAVENLNLYYSDSVTAFYEQRQHRPAWSNGKLRQNFIAELENAVDEGLYFDNYHGQTLKTQLENVKNLNDAERSRLDILLTDAFIKFGNHLYHGKTNPEELHEVWDVPINRLSIRTVLEETIENENLRDALGSLRPPHQIYRELIKASRELSDLKKDLQGFEEIPSGETVEHDEEDERIPMIQERLNFFGYLDQPDSTLTKNNQTIQEALRAFQQDNGIEADGIIGNNTIKMLNKGYDARHDEILVNLERWRWYPRELGDHYILVNIANYNLRVVKDNDTVRTHKTMVGTEARKTPVFSEEIEHLVFNPDWTIPPTIQNKDVIPGARKNSGYLANRNIQVLDKAGNSVDPSTIKWSGEEAQGYVYRQNPGPTNPLGRVKIMYPNEYLIYLHDTPSQALFERDSRAESSGCVRVQDALGLAEYLLSDQEEYSSKKIEEIIASGKTTHVPMEQKIKVYHFYWTAWRENGKIMFTDDIYNYNEKTLAALKKAS